MHLRVETHISPCPHEHFRSFDASSPASILGWCIDAPTPPIHHIEQRRITIIPYYRSSGGVLYYIGRRSVMRLRRKSVMRRPCLLSRLLSTPQSAAVMLAQQERPRPCWLSIGLRQVVLATCGHHGTLFVPKTTVFESNAPEVRNLHTTRLNHSRTALHRSPHLSYLPTYSSRS